MWPFLIGSQSGSDQARTVDALGGIDALTSSMMDCPSCQSAAARDC